MHRGQLAHPLWVSFSSHVNRMEQCYGSDKREQGLGKQRSSRLPATGLEEQRVLQLLPQLVEGSDPKPWCLRGGRHCVPALQGQVPARPHRGTQ